MTDKNYITLNITNTGNAAFADGNREREIARIIRNYTQDDFVIGDDVNLRDANGNKIGNIKYSNLVDQPDVGQVNGGCVRLSICVDNAAFGDDLQMEVGRILTAAASRIESGETEFSLLDSNGNTVGEFTYKSAESPFLKGDGIDMNAALKSGNVYIVDDGFSTIAEEDFRFVVPGPDFEVGYHQEEGDAWLVNAKGEIAPGYKDLQVVCETHFRELKADEKADLRDFITGAKTFEEFESRFLEAEDGDTPGNR